MTEENKEETENKLDPKSMIDSVMDGLKNLGSSMRLPEHQRKFTISDEELKNIYGEKIDDKIIDNFAKISALDFTYKDEAKEKYNAEEEGVDDKEHIGVSAQELETNPVTEGCVDETAEGDKIVDTRHLALANTAAIGEVSRRILAIEEQLKRLAELFPLFNK